MGTQATGQIYPANPARGQGSPGGPLFPAVVSEPPSWWLLPPPHPRRGFWCLSLGSHTQQRKLLPQQGITVLLGNSLVQHTFTCPHFSDEQVEAGEQERVGTKGGRVIFELGISVLS